MTSSPLPAGSNVLSITTGNCFAVNRDGICDGIPISPTKFGLGISLGSPINDSWYRVIRPGQESPAKIIKDRVWHALVNTIGPLSGKKLPMHFLMAGSSSTILVRIETGRSGLTSIKWGLPSITCIEGNAQRVDWGNVRSRLGQKVSQEELWL